MSRSGYSDDCDGSALQLWRGAVNKAMTGKRGQRLLVDIASAMDAMPEKRLIAEDLISADGEFCTLGVVGCARGVGDQLKATDPYARESIARLLDVAHADVRVWDSECSRESIARLLDVAPSLVAEISYFTDDPDAYSSLAETPEARWRRMRAWVASNIKQVKEAL